MRYYDVTAAVRPNGPSMTLDFRRVPEYTLKSNIESWARHGYQLEYAFAFASSDKPVFRHASEEERADGMSRIVRD